MVSYLVGQPLPEGNCMIKRQQYSWFFILMEKVLSLLS